MISAVNVDLHPEAIVNSVGKAINDLVTTDDERQKNEIALETLKQSGALEKLQIAAAIDIAQLKVNEKQAESDSFFVAGARPALMWVCVLGLAISTVVIWTVEIGVWLWRCYEQNTYLTPPEFDLTNLLSLLIPMVVGVVARTYEKERGIAGQAWKITRAPQQNEAGS